MLNKVLFLYFLKLVLSINNDQALAATEQPNINNSTVPSGDEKIFSEYSIFFIQTASRGLNYREACSVESAALTHPHKPVVVLFTEPVPPIMDTKPVMALSKYQNVFLYSINIAKFSMGTPLQDTLGPNNQFHKFPLHHKSDILRYLTLYKFGGIYSDLNMILVKNLDSLLAENWAGMESDKMVSANLISISRQTFEGDIVIESCVNTIRKTYTPFSWAQNSNGILELALKQICGGDILKSMYEVFDNTNNIRNHYYGTDCKGFRIYTPNYFYPIPYYAYQQYFLPTQEQLRIDNNTYAFYVWNYGKQHYNISQDSLYSQLARQFCPQVNEAIDNSQTEKANNSLQKESTEATMVTVGLEKPSTKSTVSSIFYALVDPRTCAVTKREAGFRPLIQEKQKRLLLKLFKDTVRNITKETLRNMNVTRNVETTLKPNNANTLNSLKKSNNSNKPNATEKKKVNNKKNTNTTKKRNNAKLPSKNEKAENSKKPNQMVKTSVRRIKKRVIKLKVPKKSNNTNANNNQGRKKKTSRTQKVLEGKKNMNMSKTHENKRVMFFG